MARTDVGLMRLCYLRDAEARADDRESIAPARLEKFAASLKSTATNVKISSSAFADLLSQLEGYFAGELSSFELPLDWKMSKGFYLSVQQAICDIPYGQTRSYKEVADALGNAPRAVGQAMAKNPICLVVPCHRVVRHDGQRGFYGGGVEAKKFLLDLESRS